MARVSDMMLATRRGFGKNPKGDRDQALTALVMDPGLCLRRHDSAVICCMKSCRNNESSCTEVSDIANILQQLDKMELANVILRMKDLVETHFLDRKQYSGREEKVIICTCVYVHIFIYMYT